MSLKLHHSVLFAAIGFAVPDIALAHSGVHAASGFSSGFLHPLGGLDHLLAMVAVGLFAAQLGRRATWLVPAAFVTMMIAGALVSLAGIDIPGIEYGILISLAAIGLPVALALGMPTPLAMTYVAFFALFHGYAHGAELPFGAEAAPYIAGFAIATAVIHAIGVATGLACNHVAPLRQGYGLRLAGGLIAMIGMGLVVA